MTFLLIGMALGAAAPVAAHTALEASTPEDGSQLAVAPNEITLDFTEPVRTRLTRVSVRGPGEEQFQQGAPQAAGDKVTQVLRPLGAAGEYQIVYRVVAVDGHPLTGTVEFTLTQAGPATSANPAAPPAATPPATPAAGSDTAADEGGVSWWFLGIVAFIVAAFAVGAVSFVRRVTREVD